MDQLDKQRILSVISADIKRMVQREVNEVVKKSSSKLPSHNGLMSNSVVNANNIYGDFNVSLNQEAYTNDNVYQKMKNQIQFRNGTQDIRNSTFNNKGKKVRI